ncbi:MAG: NRDE family protein [Betaproteobacteria bacterium]|nr:NRDE family protein [Betaproteobacteria bacterium]
MCLIVIAWRVHDDFPLVVAANRDEFHDRPAAPAGAWEDAPGVYGGRDLQAGGTWLGVARGQRFAAVTNVREPGIAPGKRSRGDLTREYLTGNESATAFASRIDGAAYSGFNLLLSDGESLCYTSNRIPAPRSLPPGIYGLSNHLLDSPWPKLVTARERCATALDALPDRAAFFDVLADDEIVPDEELPATGVSLEWERRLSAIFVRSPGYGTRASTVLTLSASGSAILEERRFGPAGDACQSSLISTSV